MNSGGVNFFNFWLTSYPIMCSFHHDWNPNLNFKNYYIATFIYGLGISFGSWISPYWFRLLGSKKGFYGISCFHLIFLYLHLKCTGIFMIIIQYFFLGAQYTMINNGNNLFISEKYKDGIIYSKYFNSSWLMFNFIWSILF